MSHRFHSIVAGLVALLCAGANAFAAAPADEVLLRRGDITVTRADFMHMLQNAVPEGGRAAVLADQRKVRMLIADLFVIRELAAEARRDGLADDALVRF